MTKETLAATFMRAWMRRGLLACLLWPLSQLFALLLAVRSLLYRLGWLAQTTLPVPVIVVGNIFIGGTGKTPFALWLLRQLIAAGYRPGVISRGYGSAHQVPCVVNVTSPAAMVGDEPLLMAQQSGCPVVVGRDRVAAGRTLLAAFPVVNVIISDDGLQHLALARQIEIVLFDGRGAGNGWLLPAGPLREPLSRRRDLTVANLNQDEVISAQLPADTVRMQLRASVARQLCNSDQYCDLSSLGATTAVTAAAGIGNPERFFSMLRLQGVRFTSLPLADHFAYSSNPFADLTAQMILITEKDAVKCRQVPEIAADARIWVVAAEVQLDDGVFEQIRQQLI